MTLRVLLQVKRHTPFQKIFQAYCTRKGLQLSDVKFIYDSDRLKAEETPQQVSRHSSSGHWWCSLCLFHLSCTMPTPTLQGCCPVWRSNNMCQGQLPELFCHKSLALLCSCCHNSCAPVRTQPQSWHPEGVIPSTEIPQPSDIWHACV